MQPSTMFDNGHYNDGCGLNASTSLSASKEMMSHQWNLELIATPWLDDSIQHKKFTLLLSHGYHSITDTSPWAYLLAREANVLDTFPFLCK